MSPLMLEIFAMSNLFDSCLSCFSLRSCCYAEDSSERVPLLVPAEDPYEPRGDDPEWLSQCKIWAKASGSAEEQRRRVIEKMLECVEKQWMTLDLSYLGLAELPPAFPPDITKLVCSHNRLSSLSENMPVGVIDIKASHNHLSVLTALPPNLQHADFSHNLIGELDDFPPHLETLNLSNNRLLCAPDIVNDKLRILNLSHNLLTVLPFRCHSWPSHLKVDVSSNAFSYISRIHWKHEMKQPHYKGARLLFESPEATNADRPILHNRSKKVKTRR